MVLAVAFGLGIVLADRGGIAEVVWLVAGASLAALTLLALTRPLHAFNLWRLALTAGLLALVVVWGGLWFITYYAASPAYVGHRPSLFHTEAITWAGEVEDCQRGRTRFRCTLALRSVTAQDEPVYPTEGRIHLFLPDSLRSLPFALGDHLTFDGALTPPQPRRNPADFDYGRYLWLERIAGTIWLDAMPQVHPQNGATIRRCIASFQTTIRAQVQQHVRSPDAQALALALLLGERQGLAIETRAAFTNTGLAHLLAVSGLHVMLVGFVLYRLLGSLLARTLWPWTTRQWVRTALTLAVLVVYLLLTGASASVVRAVVMTGLLLGASVLHRPHVSLNALGLAALALLLAKPGALFQAGFQLSFAAVSGIIVLYPMLSAVLSRFAAFPLGKSLVDSTAVTLAATWATAPVLLVHFGFVPLAGLLLNLVAIPLTAALLMASLLLVTLGYLPGLSTAFGGVIDLAAYLLDALAQWGSTALAGATVRLALDEHAALIPLLLAIAATVLWTLPRWRWRLGLASLATSVVLLLASFTQHPSLSVLFFDVGHGDAALLSFPDGRHVLIDTGGYAGRSTHAERTLLPHFERYGITHLDAVVLSHPHADHDAGLGALLDAIPIGRIIYNGDAGDREVASLAYQRADSLGIRLQRVQVGDTLQFARDVQTRVLWPPPNADLLSANDQSLVLQLYYVDVRLLFLGDIETEAELYVAEQFAEVLSSHLIKVAHHGSRTSSTHALLESMIQPESQAVISADRSHRYGLPDEEVEARWYRHNVQPWTTSDHGALWFTSDGKTLNRIDWR
ncbi:MAG: DNA internalization-related competence protein ComEC/Rec2 [Rhodothermales bacterium]